MLKRMTMLLAAVVFAPAIAGAVPTISVGTCLPKYAHFSTISAAVAAVPAGGVILVCPGVYPEQIVISKPLTLHGQSINNADRPVIAVPLSATGGSGLAVNTSSAIVSWFFAAQVLVQNVTPPGPVQISNLTVDGTGGNLGCPGGNTMLAGVFYASGTTGYVQEVTVRNQRNSGCGIGIWVQNDTAPAQSITVASNSAHDFDGFGLAAMGVPSMLSITMSGNFVSGNSPVGGIVAANVSGTISKNVVTGGFFGIRDWETDPYVNSQSPGVSISNNNVADLTDPAGFGIILREGSTASSNKLSNVATAFYLNGGSSANPGPALLANTIKNTAVAVEYNCTANTVLKSNTINDAQVAYADFPSGFVISNGVNPLYNVDTIATSSCP
jgi:hypothetical protein